MTQEEAYILIGRIEEVVNAVGLYYEEEFIPTFNQCELELLLACGDCAEQVYSYVRASNDKRVMCDCSKIMGWKLCSFVDCYPSITDIDIDPNLKKSLVRAWYFLEKIGEIYCGDSREPFLTQAYIGKIDVGDYLWELYKRSNKSNPEATDTDNTDTTTKTDITRELDTDTGEPTPQQKPILPLGLNTPEGYRIFERAVNEGWLDENFRPTKKMTKGAMSIFANEIAERFRIPNYYALIESFWGVNHLAQAYQKVSYQKNFDTLERDIKQLFN